MNRLLGPLAKLFGRRDDPRRCPYCFAAVDRDALLYVAESPSLTQKTKAGPISRRYARRDLTLKNGQLADCGGRPVHRRACPACLEEWPDAYAACRTPPVFVSVVGAARSGKREVVRTLLDGLRAMDRVGVSIDPPRRAKGTQTYLLLFTPAGAGPAAAADAQAVALSYTPADAAKSADHAAVAQAVVFVLDPLRGDELSTKLTLDGVDVSLAMPPDDDVSQDDILERAWKQLGQARRRSIRALDVPLAVCVNRFDLWQDHQEAQAELLENDAAAGPAAGVAARQLVETNFSALSKNAAAWFKPVAYFATSPAYGAKLAKGGTGADRPQIVGHAQPVDPTGPFEFLLTSLGVKAFAARKRRDKP